MNIPKDLILNETQKILPRIVDIRHLLHQIPEEGFHEHETSLLIKNELKDIGVEFKTGLAETGIIAVVHGEKPGDTVAFRSDIDGVKQFEHTTKPHTSKNDGYSHSCGHDGHMASLLGTVRILNNLKEHLHGDALFIFQPGEETGQGARRMIDSNALGETLPKCIFALHTWPYIGVGDVASKEGVMTSGNETFKVVLKGSGGHGARHYETDNPINCAAKIIPKLYKLTNLEESEMSVVSIGYVNSGAAPNVIPEELVFGGTIRTQNRAFREHIHGEFEEIIQCECEIEGVESRTEYYQYCPPVINHKALYDLFNRVSAAILPEHKVQCLDMHSTGSEDFAFFANKLPIFMFRLGVGRENGNLHSCYFDFNDDALFSSIAISTALLLEASVDTFTP